MYTIKALSKNGVYVFTVSIMSVLLLQASFASTAAPEEKQLIKKISTDVKASYSQNAIASCLVKISGTRIPTFAVTSQACQQSCHDCCLFCAQCIDVTCSTDCCVRIKRGINDCCELCGFICALLSPNIYIPRHARK